jgi:ubiquinone biosynthesis protein UbiJ
MGSQREMERVWREWQSRAGWPFPARPDAKREATPEPEADRLRDEVSSLRERLRSLEERLEKRRTDAK